MKSFPYTFLFILIGFVAFGKIIGLSADEVSEDDGWPTAEEITNAELE